MARPSKIVAALPDIHKYFEGLPSKIISDSELIKIFEENRDKWDLAKTMKGTQFLEALLKYSNFGNVKFNFRNLRPHMFFYEKTSVNAIVSNLSKKTYLSHYTSLSLHGLTEQIPKVIYVTQELTPKQHKDSKITQESIDTAFRKAQRETANESDALNLKGYKVVLLERKYSNNLGVLIDFDSTSGEEIKYTDIERTLIDITVRPNYAGGVYEVLKAYKNAKDKVSINRLSAMLKKLDYIYPYHQAIGLYLEKSGVYSENQINLIRREKIEYKFYLTYGMNDIEYSEKWKIFYPKGL